MSLSNYMKFINVTILFCCSLLISRGFSQALNCDPIPCDFVADANVDPLLQCVLVRSMGPNVILNDKNTPAVELDDANTMFYWSKTESYNTYVDRETIASTRLKFLNVQVCGSLRGLRFLYIHPDPYKVDNLGKPGTHDCYLGKYYYYNTTSSYVSTNIRGKRLTASGNWMVIKENEAKKYFARPQDYVKTMPIASKPPALDPVTGHFMTLVNLPMEYSGIFLPSQMNIQRTVARPNNLQDNLAIIIDGVPSSLGGMARQNILAVNTTTGDTRVIGTVTAFNNRIVNFPYEISANEAIRVMTHQLDYIPNPDIIIGGLVDPVQTRTWGIFCPSDEKPRFPDNFCLFGTEVPVFDQDFDSDNIIILQN